MSDMTVADKKPAKSTALQVKGWMDNESMQQSLGAALAGYMKPETFAAQCYLAAQDPKLAVCPPQSLFAAFLTCAQMGLLPGTHHRHVALIPRNNVVTVTPQWQGFKFLMERQPGVRRVTPVLVHERDKFSFDNGDLRHSYDPFDDERVFEHPDAAKKNDRACGLKGGYLKIEYDTGEVEYHPVSAAKINKNRLCAETQKLWLAWFEEMCLKTVLRDAWSKRRISIDPQLAERLGKAETVDNEALGNDPSRVTVMAPQTTGSRTAALAARLTATATASRSGDESLPDMAEQPPPAGQQDGAASDGVANA